MLELQLFSASLKSCGACCLALHGTQQNLEERALGDGICYEIIGSCGMWPAGGGLQWGGSRCAGGVEMPAEPPVLSRL